MNNNLTNDGNLYVNDQGGQTLSNNVDQRMVDNNSINNYSLQGNGSIKQEVRHNSGYSKKKIALICILAMLLIAGGLFAYLTLKKNKGTSSNNMEAFFLPKNNKYAVFNKDGKQITDFIYSYGDFNSNGVAVVQKDDLYGVINTNGKITVEFGKYKYYSSVANLYKVIDNDNHSFLIDGKGRILYDLEKYDVQTDDSVVFVYDDKEIFALNYQGDVICKYSRANNPKISASTTAWYNGSEHVTIIHYDDTNLVYNLTKKKKMLSINDSNPYYIFDTTSGSDTLLVYKYLSDSPNTNDYKEKKNYKIIKDEKVLDIDSKCVNISEVNSEAFSSTGFPIEYKNMACYDEDLNKYWFNENFQTVPGIKKSDYYEISFIDYNNYIIKNKTDSRTVNFVKNGSVVKSVEGKSILSRKGGVVKLSDSSNYKNEFYDLNGNKIIDNSFVYVKEFTCDDDVNSFLAIVSDVKPKYYNNSYSLIDNKGNKLLENYNDMFMSYGYIVVEKDGQKGILNKSGETVIPIDKAYIRIIYNDTEKFAYALYKGFDGTSSYYRFDTGDTITVKSDDLLYVDYHGYITAKTSNGTEYYTLTGKRIM